MDTGTGTSELSEQERARREADLDEIIAAIRPAIAADGGDIAVVAVDAAAGRVHVRLSGACGSCPVSSMTLSAGVERIVRDRLEWVTEVTGDTLAS